MRRASFSGACHNHVVLYRWNGLHNSFGPLVVVNERVRHIGFFVRRRRWPLRRKRRERDNDRGSAEQLQRAGRSVQDRGSAFPGMAKIVPVATNTGDDGKPECYRAVVGVIRRRRDDGVVGRPPSGNMAPVAASAAAIGRLQIATAPPTSPPARSWAVAPKASLPPHLVVAAQSTAQAR